MSKKSVLIIDTETDAIEELTGYLEDEYKISSCVSITDALIQIIKVNFDVIVVQSELVSSTINIISDTLKAVDRYNTPIIFTTDNLDPEYEAILLQNGASDYIEKPFHEKLLKLKIEKQIKDKIDRDSLFKLIEYRTNEVEKSRNTIIVAMSIMAESRDDSTGEHIFRMQKVTEIIATKFRELYPNDISNKEVNETILFSPLHDIGKIPIPDAVLKKEGKFTDEDFSVMQDHTVMGGQMLLRTQVMMGEKNELLKVAVDIATYHHEKYDGTGYPYGLKGAQIPISARIVSLADVYDALISPRPYKTKLTHKEVVDMILHGDGRIKPEHFDPKVLDAFSQCLDELEALNK